MITSIETAWDKARQLIDQEPLTQLQKLKERLASEQLLTVKNAQKQRFQELDDLFDDEQPVRHPLAHYQIIRRNGAVVPFEENAIGAAMRRAYFFGYEICTGLAQLPRYVLADLYAVWSWVSSFLSTGAGVAAEPALTAPLGSSYRVWPARCSGFFSASKVNLRNAP